MKVLVTGANGQLGYWLKKVFSDDDILSVDRDEMDITDKEMVLRIIEKFRPEVIVHGAAYTNVDGAETDQAGAFLVNETGTKNVVDAARKCGAKVVYVSTDYVFDGKKAEPYLEDDATGPQSVYGRSKLVGEEIVNTLDDYLICRTAWLYGQNGKNFVETMLRLADTRPEISVVSDQVGSPTYTKYLAQAIRFLVDKNAKGIYHTVNSGSCSWYEFACKIFELSGKSVKVSPIPAADYPSPVKRPDYSVLSNQKLADLGYKMPDWAEALEDYLRERL